MKFFRKKEQTEQDMLERRLDTISELTRGLGKKEFNNLIEAVKAVYEARQKLTNVKSEDEKEVEDIDEIEKVLKKENFVKLQKKTVIDKA